jgi:outer membrane protein assembly factor BamB
MLIVSKLRIIIFVGLVILSTVQVGFTGEKDSERLISPELLKHAGLEIVWESALPTKNDESLERLLFVGDCIYAISDESYVLSLNRENGKTIFAKEVTPAGLQVEELNLLDGKLISIAGNKLIEFNPETGIESNSMDFDFSIMCPAEINSLHLYLSGSDKRLHVLNKEDGLEYFDVGAESDSLITSIIAYEDYVIFGTDQGNVISMMSAEPKRLWQFNASEAIPGLIIKDGMSLFFASEDTNVYRVDIPDMFRHRLVWKCQMAGMLKTTPRVTRNVVYQQVYSKDLTAIEKYSGSILWSLPGGIDLLAEDKGRAYVMTKNETLVVMENSTGKRLYSVNFKGISRYTSNTTDSKIYVADKSGRIACIKPVK